jgi:cytochrome P450 family 130
VRKLRVGEVATEAAVDELIRYESTVQALARTTSEPVRLHGVELPTGATVLLLYGAANRDDRRWDRPDTLDVTRPRRRSLAFGEGLHFCLGAMLARLEARVVVEMMLAETPEFWLDGTVTRTVKWSDWGVLGARVAW